MQDNYTTKGKHLTIDSRRLIERWKKKGKSNREIASLLGKVPQTIHTEIKRGTLGQEIKLDQGTKGKDSPLS
ncbi:transposase-like protein%2C IS1239 [Streptococcus pneumoniae]|nr:transposase-like protein%2C IS1239 [Streptococcus pneumoniae]